MDVLQHGVDSLLNVVNGCTDPNASNFDPLANTDDGSCTYPGCTDSLATNFDPTANLDDSSCTYSCAYYGFDDEINIEVFTDLYGAENGWELINVATGDTMAGVPVGGYGKLHLQLTTTKFVLTLDVTSLTGMILGEMVGLTSTELKDIY